MIKCCVIGHRKIDITDKLKSETANAISQLINEGVQVFLFGSRSEFTNFCYNIVTDLQKTYPYIIRVFVRAEYPIIEEEYEKYLKTFYEETYYYDRDYKSGKLSYIKRNEHLVDTSDCCLFYYNDNYTPTTKTKSGTRLAYDYAIKKGKRIINIYKKPEV